jgi:ATP-dependent helicase/nuclease subunit A
MPTSWRALREPVPVREGAVRRHVPASPVACSTLVATLMRMIEADSRVSTWLVAPSRRIARQWLDTIALSGTPVFNVRATTPGALCYDLAAARLATEGWRVASPRAALVLVEKVLAQADRGGRLRYFSGPRSYRRLAERMFESLSTLRMAGLTADDIRRKTGFGDGSKNHDLALLLENYAAELAVSRLVDAADVARAAIEAVAAGDSQLHSGRILIPERLELRPLERRLVAALGDAVHGLPIDAEPPAFTDPTTGPSVKFFRAIGEVNEVRGVLRRCLAAGIPLDTVELLHTDATTYPSLVQDVLAVMDIGSDAVPTPAAELPVTFAEGLPIREARPARALAAWLAWRDEGYPQWRLHRMLRDGLIALGPTGLPDGGDTTSVGGTSPTADADAAEAGLPSATHVTRAGLLRELRRLRIGFDLQNVPAMIRSAIAAVEAAPLGSFVSGGRDEDEEPEFDPVLAAHRRGRRLASLRALAEIVDRLVDCEPAPNATASELVASAATFLERVAAARSQFDNNAKNRLQAEIADMARWLGRLSAAEPRDILEWLAGLPEALVVMGNAPRPGCLHVASITAGGHSGRPHTFIVGLDETRLPGPGRSDPVLPDADRAALSAELELSATGVARARADFWSLLGRLRGDVHLSYNCRDLQEQAEVFPSPLLLEVYRRRDGQPQATLADFIAVVNDETESFVPRDAGTALSDAEWWLATLGESPSLPAVERAIESHGASLARGLEAERARRSARFTPWDGHVPAAGAALDPTGPHGRVASANSLERLGACPRRFFFHYGLGVVPPDQLEPEQDRWLDHLEHGNVLHKVLEKFMRRFVHAGPGRPPKDAPRPKFAADEAAIVAILDDVLAAKRAEKPSNDETAVAAIRRELLDAVRTFLRAEEEYCATTGSLPVALEAAIGFMPHGERSGFNRDQPVSLPLADDRALRVHGYVDRIDIDGRAAVEGGYTIIDYKKGRSTRFKKGGRDPLAVFDGGRRLQHGLYVLMVRHVAREATGMPEADVTQFAYVFPGSDTRGERLEWTAAQLDGVTRVVEKLCDIAAAGAFLPTNEKDDCLYCSFLDVCGDPDTTARLASGKLRGDDGRYGRGNVALAELFEGVREAGVDRPKAAVARPPAPPFEPAEEPAPGDLQDAEARDAIRTDLGTTMLVEASAGTGKTTCMVDRMTALIRTGTATAGQIAAITFTKKAAAELARRFRERLEEGAADARLPAPERQRLGAALAEIDSAVIGTVHSFCGRLLRERPIEAGLDPSFTTLDPVAEQTLRGQSWRQFCDRVGRDETLSAHRQALEEAGMDLRDLRRAFDTFISHGDVADWPHEAVAVPEIRGLMGDIFGEIEKLLEEKFVPINERSSTDKLMGRLEGLLRAWNLRPDDSPAAVFRAAEGLEGKCPNAVQETWFAHLPRGNPRQAALRELERWWDGLVARLEGPLRQWRAYRYQFVIPLLSAARDQYEQLRIDSGVVSFHDLLVKTAALLRSRPSIRVSFAARHPFLLVDEFQDTDPLQAEIMLLLAAAEPDATDWRTAALEPGRLFVVGDPKQSIYRFRRADIDTFEFVKKRIADSGGRELHLSTNFRTNRELVGWVNQSFADRFAAHRREASTAYGPTFTPSEPGRRVAVAGVLSGLRQLRVSSSGVAAEAEAVARFIRRAIDHGLTVSRASATEPATCRPEDFMIVTYDTSELSTYAAALNAVGLPCDVTGRKGLQAADDLAPLRLCLRVVADPEDSIAALAVLRGPVFGFNDAELYAFHQSGGRIDGRLHVPEGCGDAVLAARIRAAAATFHRWRTFAGSMPLAAAVERLVADAGLSLVASEAGGLAGRHGRSAAGTIATFIELVRAERSQLTSVQDVIDRIDDLVGAGDTRQDFDTLSIDAKAGGAVRVMNLHKVKGLEAPVVFLCDQNGPNRDRGPAWHVSRVDGSAKGYLKVARPGFFGKHGPILAAPSGWDGHEATEKLYLEAEYLRLNYVAGTRPGTCLVASVFENKDGKISGGWRELAPGIEAVTSLPDLEPHPEAERARTAAQSRPVADAAALNAARAEAAGRMAVVRAATFGTVTPRDFLTEPAERIRHTGRGLGQDWGTVIHRLLELAVLDLARPSGSLDVAAVAASLVQESDLADSGIDREELVRRAVALVADIRRSDVWRRLRDSRPHHVEVPFSIAVVAGEIPPGVAVDRGPALGGHDQPAASVPVLIRGQIDAVFRNATSRPPAGMTHWEILDWKTTSVTDADATKLVQHYRPQLTLYARCWASGLVDEPEGPRR